MAAEAEVASSDGRPPGGNRMVENDNPSWPDSFLLNYTQPNQSRRVHLPEGCACLDCPMRLSRRSRTSKAACHALL